MIRLTRPLLAGLIGGVLGGCSDAPRAILTAKSVKAPAGVEPALALPSEPPPMASDPAAAELVKAAIAAHTGGDASKLERLKTFWLTRKGEFSASVPPRPMTWKFSGRWPHDFRADVESESINRMTLSRTRSASWKVMGALGPTKMLLEASEERGLVADATYEWISLLVPLAEPGLVAVPYPERAVSGRPAAGVRVSGPNLPSAVVHFDKETKRLAQFGYEGFEGTKPVVKEHLIRTYREVNGVQVPDKLGIRWDGRPTVEWELLNLEFPVDFPAKAFEEP